MTGTARERAALALLCAAHGALVLDLTVVNVALPTIADDLALAPGALHWVVSAYALAFGGALLVGGRIADRIGHRVALAIGIAIFSVASLVSALAPTAELLVAGRLVQGLGAALADPAALGLLATVFPERSARNRALAAWASTTALAAVVGLLAGGAATQLLSWRCVFLVAIPLGAAIPVFALLLPAQSASRRAASFDGLSALLGSAGIVSLAAALSTVTGAGGPTIATAVFGAATVALASGFVRRERRSPRPLVPPALLANPVLVGSLATGALGGALVLGSFFLLPVALGRELGLTPLAAGALLLASRAPALVWSRLVRHLLDSVGSGTTATIGMALFVVAELSFTRIGAGGVAGALPGLLVLGLAIPCVFMSASTAVLASVQAEEAGSAAGLLSTAQWLGGAAGVALAALGAAADGSPLATDSGFWICLALAAAGLVVGLATARLGRACATCPAAA
jgi:MFS family permease